MKHNLFNIASLHQAIETVINEVKNDGLPPITVAIVDKEGNLVYFYKMDATPSRTINISISKAYTSVKMLSSTKDFNTRLHNERVTIIDFQDLKLTSIAGGIPIRIDEALVGGIGISGRKPDDDHKVAERILEEMIRCAANN